MTAAEIKAQGRRLVRRSAEREGGRHRKVRHTDYTMRTRALAATAILYAVALTVGLRAQAPQPTAAPTAKPEEGIPVTDATVQKACGSCHKPDEKGQMQTRVVMQFHPRIAPVKAAVFPLVKKDGMPEIAQKIYRALKPHANVFYDEKGAVGRRYRRQDEAGTPFCFTIDGQTAQDNTVTIRERDSTQQRRIPVAAVAEELRRLLRPGPER